MGIVTDAWQRIAELLQIVPFITAILSLGILLLQFNKFYTREEIMQLERFTTLEPTVAVPRQQDLPSGERWTLIQYRALRSLLLVGEFTLFSWLVVNPLLNAGTVFNLDNISYLVVYSGFIGLVFGFIRVTLKHKSILRVARGESLFIIITSGFGMALVSLAATIVITFVRRALNL